jgi:hypothetical protein
MMVPETCWASNKICNKNHLLHLVGILFPRIEYSLFCVVLFIYEHYFVWCCLVTSIISYVLDDIYNVSFLHLRAMFALGLDVCWAVSYFWLSWRARGWASSAACSCNSYRLNTRSSSTMFSFLCRNFVEN